MNETKPRQGLKHNTHQCIYYFYQIFDYFDKQWIFPQHVSFYKTKMDLTVKCQVWFYPTRFLRSSHPSPPAPMTRILHVSSKNWRDYIKTNNNILLWKLKSDCIKKYVPILLSSLKLMLLVHQCVTSVLGSKSGWVNGPVLSKNFFTWFQRPSQSQPMPPCTPSTAILDDTTINSTCALIYVITLELNCFLVTLIFFTIVATLALTFREIKHDIPEGDWNRCWDMYLRGSTIKNSVRFFFKLFYSLKVTEAESS